MTDTLSEVLRKDVIMRFGGVIGTVLGAVITSDGISHLLRNTEVIKPLSPTAGAITEIVIGVALVAGSVVTFVTSSND